MKTLNEILNKILENLLYIILFFGEAFVEDWDDASDWLED